MKIVIDIPDKVKNYLDQTTTYDSEDYYVQHFSLLIADAIKTGIPLPKGHGELVDKDVILDMMNHGILEEYITVMGGVIPADR